MKILAIAFILLAELIYAKGKLLECSWEKVNKLDPAVERIIQKKTGEEPKYLAVFKYHDKIDNFNIYKAILTTVSTSKKTEDSFYAYFFISEKSKLLSHFFSYYETLFYYTIDNKNMYFCENIDSFGNKYASILNYTISYTDNNKMQNALVLPVQCSKSNRYINCSFRSGSGYIEPYPYNTLEISDDFKEISTTVRIFDSFIGMPDNLQDKYRKILKELENKYDNAKLQYEWNGKRYVSNDEKILSAICQKFK
jgi:hypothetical protein